MNTKKGYKLPNLRVRRSRLKEGDRYGRYTLCWPAGYKSYGSTGHRFVYWLCCCDCGQLRIVFAASLTQGTAQSCGCLARELASQRQRGKPMPCSNLKHGYAKRQQVVPEYHVWATMKRRCHNPNTKSYGNYGARGISVCERWRNSFENFIADMGRRPSAQHSVERMNNDGNYEPANCKWATRKEQRQNQRSFTNPHEALYQAKALLAT